MISSRYRNKANFNCRAISPARVKIQDRLQPVNAGGIVTEMFVLGTYDQFS